MDGPTSTPSAACSTTACRASRRTHVRARSPCSRRTSTTRHRHSRPISTASLRGRWRRIGTSAIQRPGRSRATCAPRSRAAPPKPWPSLRSRRPASTRRALFREERGAGGGPSQPSSCLRSRQQQPRSGRRGIRAPATTLPTCVRSSTASNSCSPSRQRDAARSPARSARPATARSRTQTLPVRSKASGSTARASSSSSRASPARPPRPTGW